METFEIVKLVIVFLAGYFILRFLWSLLSGVFKVILLAVIVAVGIYVVKPEILYDTFGKDTVEATASKTKDVIKKGVDKTTEVIKNSSN